MMTAPILSVAVHNHTQEAFANFQRYELFRDNPVHTSWAVVLLFYSALHLVDAYHHAQYAPLPMGSHTSRNQFVRTAIDIRTIEPYYYTL